jgi:hypothetical protein
MVRSKKSSQKFKSRWMGGSSLGHFSSPTSCTSAPDRKAACLSWRQDKVTQKWSLTKQGRVNSSTNTPVMQGEKQMHIERRCDCELPRQSCRLVRACIFFLTQVLLWFCSELLRKGSAKGGGICDAQVEVHPVNFSLLESRAVPVN